MEPERRLGEIGLAEALNRLDARALDREDYKHLIPFAEALSWLFALHEWHRVKMGNDPFFNLMRSSQEGKAILGMAWVRGAVQHHLADVTKIVTTGGSFIPMPIGTVDSQIATAGRSEIRWLELSELSTQVDPHNHNRHEYYREFVEGRPLAVPLHAAQDLLMSLPT